MGLVPDWFQQKGTNSADGARVERFYRSELLLTLAYFLYCLWLLPVLTDWVSFAVDEGYTAFAAERLRAGDWPHRDFFFLWTPGILWLHGALQALGANWLVERAAALAASAGTVFFCLIWAKRLGLNRSSRALLFLLLAGWGFSLWNIPYSSWYAVFFSIAASWFLPKRAIFAGLLFGAAFWFKQNIGLLSLIGAVAALYLQCERQKIFPLAMSAALAILVPLLGFFIGGQVAFLAAVNQIFLFPIQYKNLMSEPLATGQIAAPLSCFGLWIFSLYLVRKGTMSRSMILLQLGWMAYALYRWQLDGAGFAAGSLYLFSLLAWPLMLMVLLQAHFDRRKNEGLIFFLPAAGAFLQVYPRWDFQHFLFVFPLVAVLLIFSLSWLADKYPQKPRLWLHAPLFGLLLCAIPPQLRLCAVRVLGERDPYGRVAVGEGLKLSKEMHEVGDFLRSEGIKPGAPVLVFPNANYFYSLEGFSNPTPHNQFFPGYVEAYGQNQKDVLPMFERAGGKFLVLQKRSGTERNVPVIYEDILARYRLLRDFPVHFSVWERKP